MSAAKMYAKRRAHLSPSALRDRPAANATNAPAVDTSREARMRSRPSPAFIALVLQSFGRLHQLLELFLVDGMTARRRPVLVVVRHHQAVALEPASANHRPFDDDAD